MAVLLVGLTGRIGSGKSTLARYLEELGAAVLDADALVAELLDGDPEVQRAIRQRFGEDLFGPSGLDRRALAARVFNDEKARGDLEAILHPRVTRLARQRLPALAKEREVVVFEAPLLYEAGAHELVDLIVVVDAPREDRFRRLVERRGMDSGDARARIDAQEAHPPPWEEGEGPEVLVVENHGGEEALRREAARLMDALRKRAARTAG